MTMKRERVVVINPLTIVTLIGSSFSFCSLLRVSCIILPTEGGSLVKIVVHLTSKYTDIGMVDTQEKESK